MYKIFLDDDRVPTQIYPSTNNDEWIIIRNLTDFKNTIEEKGIPDLISFDNDLGASLEEGKDAVKWLVYDKQADIRNMNFNIHSYNTSGVRDFMRDLLKNWKKHLISQDEEPDDKLEESEYNFAHHKKIFHKDFGQTTINPTTVAKNVSKKIDFPKLKKINCGHNGCAYDMGNGKVLKITKDKSEAVESNKIKNKQIKHLAEIYSVFKLTGRYAGLYAIICEKLKTPKEIHNLNDKLNFFLNDKIHSADEFLYDYAHDDIKKDSDGFDYIVSLLSQCKDERIIWYFNQMIELIDELKRNKIESYDFTPNNLGFKKDGSIGYFDLGFGGYKGGGRIDTLRLNEDFLRKKIRNIITESDDDVDWDLYELLDDVKRDIMSDFWHELMKEKPNDSERKYFKARQPWEIIPFETLERQWNEYMKWGKILPQYEKTIENIEKLVTKNILKVNVNTELAGHTTSDPRYDWKDYFEAIGIPEDKWDEYAEYAYEYIGDYIDDGKGQIRISDFGLEKLNQRLSLLRKENDINKKLPILDSIMSVLHMRSDIASWFVEGGSSSLSKLSGQERD